MLFLVDRDLPGVSLDQLRQARQRAVAASARLTTAGRPVAYLRSLWLPGDARVVCLFAAASAELVEEVNRFARFPFLRLAEAVELGGEAPEDPARPAALPQEESRG